MLYGIVVVLVVTGKETGLDVNAEKAISLYMVRSWDQQAVQSQNIKIGSESFEWAEQFNP